MLLQSLRSVLAILLSVTIVHVQCRYFMNSRPSSFVVDTSDELTQEAIDSIVEQISDQSDYRQQLQLKTIKYVNRKAGRQVVIYLIPKSS